VVRGRRRTKPPGVPAADGLVTRFIRHTLEQHVEPTRRGTPRGAPVGFSRKKLAAALLTLTSADVKQTARAIGVSYSLARKWRTETAFRARVERLEDEVVEAFGAAVEASVVAAIPAERPHGPLDPLVDALQARRAQWMAAHTGDAASYGPRLRDKLTARLLDQGDGVGRLWRLAVLQAVAALWAPAGPDRGPLDARGLRAWLAMLQSIVLALEPETPAGPRTLARVYLRWLHRQLPGPTHDRVAPTPSPSGRPSKGPGPPGCRQPEPPAAGAQWTARATGSVGRAHVRELRNVRAARRADMCSRRGHTGKG
jgi:hypothetical protein